MVLACMLEIEVVGATFSALIAMVVTTHPRFPIRKYVATCNQRSLVGIFQVYRATIKCEYFDTYYKTLQSTGMQSNTTTGSRRKADAAWSCSKTSYPNSNPKDLYRAPEGVKSRNKKPSIERKQHRNVGLMLCAQEYLHEVPSTLLHLRRCQNRRKSISWRDQTTGLKYTTHNLSRTVVDYPPDNIADHGHTWEDTTMSNRTTAVEVAGHVQPFCSHKAG